MPGIENILASVSGAPSASEGLFRLMLQQQNQQAQQQRAEQFRQQDMLQREQLLQQRQANDPLRQAQITTAQNKNNQPDLASMLSGSSRSGLQANTGGVTGTVYGGPQPTMDQSNQRIRDIVAALSQGDRPSSPLVDAQTTQDFTPDYGTNANPKMGSDTFRLQGFGDIGFNPLTHAFTNIGLPDQTQQAKPAATANGQQPVDMEAMNRRTMLAAALHKAGVPEKQIAERLDAEAPLPNKEIPVEKLSKLFKFNPATESFDAAPANLTDQQAREQGFRTYDQKQRDSVESMKDINVAFQQLKSALSDIQGKSWSDLKLSQLTSGQAGGPEGAVYQKAAINFTTVFDKFLGGVRGAASPAMQAIRMKIIPSIMSSQQVSDKLMGDLEDLIKSMSSSHMKAAVGIIPQADMAVINAKADKIIAAAKTEGKYKYDPGEAQQQTPSKAGWLNAGGINYRIK